MYILHRRHGHLVSVADVEILQHSDISFHERLYSSFDVDVFCVELCDSLTAVLRNPMVYIRGMVPCFDVLIKLQQVCEVQPFFNNPFSPTLFLIVAK